MNTRIPGPPPFLKTTEVATALRTTSSTILGRVHREGSFYGIKPRRLPNGHYRWPTAEILSLVREVQ